MVGLILAILLLLPCLAWGQSAGVGGPYFKDDCTTIPAHVTNKILCWDQTAAQLKTWSGSAWVNVTSGGTGTVTHTPGALTLNALVLGNSAGDVKALAFTGYVFGNGASAPTASATVPTTDLTGALPAANFPALTGDITTTAASLVTALSTTGISAGTYGQVTVDPKGRVTAAAIIADMAHGGTDVATAADDSVLVSTGSAWVAKVLTTCVGANKAVTYDASTNAFGCNTITVGTGTVTNTGTLTSNAFVIGNGGVDVKPVVITGLVLGAGASVPAAYAGSACVDPSYVQSISASGVATCNTPAGAGDVSHPAGGLSSEFAIVGDGAGQIRARSVVGYYKGAGGSPLSGVPTIPAADGGTGQTSYAVGDELVATGATALSRRAAVGLGQMVISQGAGVASIWSPSGFLSTSLRTPLVVGDSTVGGFLALRSTSAVGTTDSIRFQVGNTGATEAARITNSGNIGIGTVTPNAKLEVSGVNKIAIDVSNSSLFFSNPTPPNSWGGGGNPNYDRFRLGVESNVYILATDAGGTGTVRPFRIGVFGFGDVTGSGINISVNNRVGIGTASPGSLLHLQTGGGMQIGAPIGGDVANSINITGSYLVNGTPIPTAAGAATRVAVFSGTTTLTGFANLVFDGSGRLGVGTATPGFTLDVAGLSKVARLSRLTLADANTASSFDLCANCYLETTDKYLVNGFAGRLEMLPADGIWKIQTAPSGTAGATATLTTRVSVTQPGLVGINQTTPLHWLDIDNTSSTEPRISGQRISGSVTGNITTTTVTATTGDGAGGASGASFPLYVAGKFADFQVTAGASSTTGGVISDMIRQRVTLGGSSGGAVGRLTYSEFTGSFGATHQELYGDAVQTIIQPSTTACAGRCAFPNHASQQFIRHSTDAVVSLYEGQVVNAPSDAVNGAGGIYAFRAINGLGGNDIVTATTAYFGTARQAAPGNAVESWVYFQQLRDLASGTDRYLVKNDGRVVISASVAATDQLSIAALSGDVNGANIKLTDTGDANPTVYVASRSGGFEVLNGARAAMIRIEESTGNVTVQSLNIGTKGVVCVTATGTLTLGNNSGVGVPCP